MKINIKLYETVDLDFEQMADVAIETIRSVYHIPKDAFIRDDYLTVWYNTHGSGMEEQIRKATEEDNLALRVIKKIEDKKGI